MRFASNYKLALKEDVIKSLFDGVRKIIDCKNSFSTLNSSSVKMYGPLGVSFLLAEQTSYSNKFEKIIMIQIREENAPLRRIRVLNKSFQKRRGHRKVYNNG